MNTLEPQTIVDLSNYTQVFGLGLPAIFSIATMLVLLGCVVAYRLRKSEIKAMITLTGSTLLALVFALVAGGTVSEKTAKVTVVKNILNSPSWRVAEVTISNNTITTMTLTAASFKVPVAVAGRTFQAETPELTQHLDAKLAKILQSTKEYASQAHDLPLLSGN